MGHIVNSKSNLVPLVDRLNKNPIGLVDNEILRELLALLFDEKEAYVASKFPLEDATLPEMSKRTQIPEAELLPILESMANKGLVTDMPYDDTTYYFLMPGVIGFFEYTFMKHRTDIPVEKVARLMTEYFRADPETGQISEFFGSKTPLTRAMVYEEHIPVSSEVVSYESARDIIMKSSYGAATMCFCRHKKEHLGEKCKKGMPVEGTCIVLGNGAKFFTRRGFAQEKTKEELLKIIDLAHSLKLTHVTDNIRHKPSFICNCCGCCCEIMAGVQAGYYDGVAKTSYIAMINPELCDYCGECFTACNVRAIGRNKSDFEAKRTSEVDTAVCLGCGACIAACEKGAITLIHREDYVIPLHKKRDLYKTILKEKRKLMPWIVTAIQRKIKNIFYTR